MLTLNCLYKQVEVAKWAEKNIEDVTLRITFKPKHNIDFISMFSARSAKFFPTDYGVMKTEVFAEMTQITEQNTGRVDG